MKWNLGRIVQSDSNGFSKFQFRELKETANNAGKFTFQHEDQMIQDAQTKIEALAIDGTKSSGNG